MQEDEIQMIIVNNFVKENDSGLGVFFVEM